MSEERLYAIHSQANTISVRWNEKDQSAVFLRRGFYYEEG